jgi:capsular exopolysaccharide synthesis family protein
VATGLAVASAHAGQRTLLIDADLHRRTLGTRFGLSPAPGLSDYLRGSAELSEVVQELAVGGSVRERSTPTTLTCIPAGTATSSPSELLAGKQLEELLTRVSTSFDLVVLDTGPLLAVSETRAIVSLVDAVVLCVRTHQTALDQAVAARSTLERFRARRVGLVVTGVKDRDESYYGGYYGFDEKDVAVGPSAGARSAN